MEQNFRNELNQAIDFSSVLTQISVFSSFSCAKEKILNALPVFDKLEIQEQLNYAKEAIQFEQAGGLLSLSGANDISLPVAKASKQMTLTSKELISIYHFNGCQTSQTKLGFIGLSRTDKFSSIYGWMYTFDGFNHFKD